jgi:CheY-like chemotaxis protein
MHVQINEGIRSVLVVEDEMIVAILMEDLLRSLGVDEVHICADAASALELIAKTPVDCVVLDLLVRDGSTRHVADTLADRGIPFVFSSGSDIGALESRHAARPMLSKPFLDDDFKLIVLDTVTLSRSRHIVGGAALARVATSGATD